MEKKFKDILDRLCINICITDADTYKIIFMNQNMKKDYGIDNPEGKICWEILQENQMGPCSFCRIPGLKECCDEGKTVQWKEKSLKNNKTYDNYESLIRWNGQLVHLHQSYDVYSSELLYESLIHSTDDYIYLSNTKTGIFRYSPAMVREFRFPGEIVENPMVYWKKIVHPDDWEKFYKSNMEIADNMSDYHAVEFRAKNRKGEYQWLKCRGQVIRDEYGNSSLFAGMMTKLGRESKIDALTQLLKHSEFLSALEKSVKENPTQIVRIIILDIDRFRQFNSIYGRDAGDKILKKMAGIVYKVIPENGALYRLDGDRMGVILKNGTEEEAEKIYKAIQKELLCQKEWERRKKEISVSAGCAAYPLDGRTMDEVYHHADYALRYAKNRGRNRMEFFTESILREKQDSIEVGKQLRKAIRNDYKGFYLNYQPQVDAATGEITGVEALMRWTDSKGNTVSPLVFIPIMEEDGMIYEAGLWVLKKAIQDGKNWIARKPSFKISINVSALQLLEENFLSDFQRIVQEENFPYENLVIELTESYMIQNIALFQDKFNQIHKIGVRIAMDDFGTGYSSLEMLKTIPVDVVKIDRAFTKNIVNSSFDATLISMMVKVCHCIGVLVCLEGVETKEEYECVKDMELDRIQGYYFGKPEGSEEILTWLEKK